MDKDELRCPLREMMICAAGKCAWWVDYAGDNWSIEGCALKILALYSLDSD